ncbi:MAG: T9SS type A sorting domain-containing protein [Ignavibacteria bacterium]|nr:T9SS type A sorting domain-containing protein [Ignavibacteria bacterium]
MKRSYFKNSFLPFTLFLFSLIGMFLFVILEHEPRQGAESEEPLEETMGGRDNPEAAMEYRYAMLAGPTGELDPMARMKAISFAEANNLARTEKTGTDLTWQPVGPGNIGGRIRSIIINPDNTNQLLIGAVSGGVWKSTNKGVTWLPKLDNGPFPSIGSMVIDPNAHSTVYAGTGEGWRNADAIYGGGIYKSTDFGETWNILTSTTGTWDFKNVLKIVVDANSNIYAITRASNKKHGVGSYLTNGGLFRSTNGGDSWTKINPSTSTDNYYNPNDLLVLAPGVLLFTTGPVTNPGSMYKSTDDGVTWKKITTGLPTANYDRIAMAKDPSNANRLFAVFGSSNTASPYFGLENIYKSTDAGESWTAVTRPPNLASTSNLSYLSAQEWYDNVIAIDPFNSNRIVVGGVDLVASTDGGTTWSQLTYWHLYYGSPFVHADHHALVFDPVTSGILYSGNDGGIYRTTNSGSTWTALNNGLAITQFYGGAVSKTGTMYTGGTQDNGHLKYGGSGTTWVTVNGGDGGYAAIDQSNSNVGYGEYVYLQMGKTTDGGTSFESCTTGLTDAGSSTLCLFISPFAINTVNANILIAGSDKIWLTTDAAKTWNPMCSTLVTGKLVSAVAIQSSGSNYLAFAGITGGQIFKCSGLNPTLGQANVWVNISPANNNGAYVRRVVIDPADTNIIYACYGGYNNSAIQKHVWRSTNQGSSWADISGNLPDVPVHSLIVNPTNRQNLFVSTETGIFQTTDLGTTWVLATTGMPKYAPVDEIVLQSGTNKLFAFTHGRSVFQADMPVSVKQGTGTTAKDYRLMQNYPNPFNPSTTISYFLASAGNTSLILYDIRGKQVASLVNCFQQAGSHEVRFDFRNVAAGKGFPSGVYIYELKSGNYRESKKMNLIK